LNEKNLKKFFFYIRIGIYNITTYKVRYDMKKVNPNSPMPLYYQIKESILSMIDEGIFEEGDLIPPERELCEKFDVSRMTVNKAIMTLVNEGVLYRQQGKGTYVSGQKIKQSLEVKGFSEQMREKGLESETKLLGFEEVEANSNQIKKLELESTKAKLIEISRLHIIEGEPFALEIVYIPRLLCPDLKKEDVEGRSLYAVLKEKYDYEPARAKQTIEPIALNDYESVTLNQCFGALALKFRRLTFLNDGRPFEYTREVYRSDRYKYEIELD
jgi:GntR family transcriptional regulator